MALHVEACGQERLASQLCDRMSRSIAVVIDYRATFEAADAVALPIKRRQRCPQISQAAIGAIAAELQSGGLKCVTGLHDLPA